MYDPSLKNDIQSVNYKPESRPGAGDGTGWRLCKNGDFQLGKISQVDGVMYTEHASIHVDYVTGSQPRMLIGEAMMRQASITPAQLDLPIHQVHGDRVLHKGELAQSEIEIRMTIGDGGALLDMNDEERTSLAKAIKRCVIDTIESSPLNGARTGRITDEQTCRAEADTALASRIGAIDLHAWAGVGASLDLQLGKEYLAIPQPGGDVVLGRLGGKPVGIKDLVGSMQRLQEFRDKPGKSAHEFAGGLCRELPRMDVEGARETFVSSVLHRELPLAPMTGNGKVPLNNLPRPVDDDK